MTKDTSNPPRVQTARIVSPTRRTRQMFEEAPNGAESWSTYLTKAVGDSQARSTQKENTGVITHPFDWAAAKRFKAADPHHSSCMEAKVGATVGLGFVKDEVDKKLNGLCLVSWQDCITAVTEDFWTVGNGFMEIVRDGNEIVGAFHIGAEYVHVEIEDGQSLDYHYRLRQSDGSSTMAAAYGDKESFVSRRPGNVLGTSTNFNEPDTISEIIHIRRPSAMHRWYGMPDWLAAVAQIELAQCITQYNYDFFLNNGVPEFIFMVMGADLGDVWDKEVVPALKGATGFGKGHSTLALNIPHSDVEAFVQKMGTEMSEGWFQDMLDTVAVRIVTAHRVPPIIAGIQIPGKLGANNEHVNAMWLFQGLVIGPAQKVIKTCLSTTLGGEGGVSGLSADDMFDLNTIPDTIPTAQVEVAGSPTEPNKTVGDRKDIPGSSKEPTPQQRQSASLSKRIEAARDVLGDDIVDAIIEKQMVTLAAAMVSKE